MIRSVAGLNGGRSESSAIVSMNAARPFACPSVILLVMSASWAVCGCGGRSLQPFGDNPDAATGATGGESGSGGSHTGGGSSGSGGLAGAGGGAAGRSGSGGSGTGGTLGSGGAIGSGGRVGSGGVVGTGGIAATGGRAGTGGRSGSGGASGTGGASGAGGTSGRGGASGMGGAGGTVCQQLAEQYGHQVPAAKECVDLGAGTQCQMQVPAGLDCGIYCMTVVNDSRALGATYAAWMAAGCAPPASCPPIRCVALRFGNCLTDITSQTRYRCSDAAP
jgi:hypothetical protein